MMNEGRRTPQVPALALVAHPVATIGRFDPEARLGACMLARK
jgi:hypothetical protein